MKHTGQPTPQTATVYAIPVIFNLVAYSTSPGAYNATTGTYTIPQDGYYSVNYAVGGNGTGAGWIVANLYANGIKQNQIVQSASAYMGSSAYLAAVGAAQLYLQAGNTLNVAYDSIVSQGALVRASIEYYTQLQIAFIRPK